MKNKRLIAIILGLCIIFLILIVLILNKSKNKNYIICFDKGESIEQININNHFSSFDLKLNSEWKCTQKPNLTINDSKINNYIKTLKEIKAKRSFSANKLSEFGLDSSEIELIINTSKKHQYKLVFSYIEASKLLYVYNEADNEIYLIDSKNNWLCEVNPLSFAQVDSLPDFNSEAFNKIVIKNNNNTFNIESSLANVLDNSENNQLTYNGFDFDEKDIQKFINYICSLKLVKIFSCMDSFDELHDFGLENPKATIEFYYNNKSLILQIGNQSEIFDKEYYVNIIDSDKKNYMIYTIDSFVAEFLIELSEEQLNGEISNKTQLLLDEEIPVFTEESLNYVVFKNSNGDFTVAKDNDNKYKYINNNESSDSGIVCDTFSKQMINYLCKSSIFAYGDVLYDSAIDGILDNFGLLTDYSYILISYTYEKKDGSSEEIVWKLMVGKDYNEEYSVVHADNSKKIYLFNKKFTEYIKSVTLESFDGSFVYDSNNK